MEEFRASKNTRDSVKEFGRELLRLSDTLLADDFESIFSLMLPMLEKEQEDLAIMKTFISNISERGALTVDERRRLMLRLNDLEEELSTGKNTVFGLLSMFKAERARRRRKE